MTVKIKPINLEWCTLNISLSRIEYDFGKDERREYFLNLHQLKRIIRNRVNTVFYGYSFRFFESNGSVEVHLAHPLDGADLLVFDRSVLLEAIAQELKYHSLSQRFVSWLKSWEYDLPPQPKRLG